MKKLKPGDVLEADGRTGGAHEGSRPSEGLCGGVRGEVGLRPASQGGAGHAQTWSRTVPAGEKRSQRLQDLQHSRITITQGGWKLLGKYQPGHQHGCGEREAWVL